MILIVVFIALTAFCEKELYKGNKNQQLITNKHKTYGQPTLFVFH